MLNFFLMLNFFNAVTLAHHLTIKSYIQKHENIFINYFLKEIKAIIKIIAYGVFWISLIANISSREKCSHLPLILSYEINVATLQNMYIYMYFQ